MEDHEDYGSETEHTSDENKSKEEIEKEQNVTESDEQDQPPEQQKLEQQASGHEQHKMPEDPAHVPCESEQQLSSKTAKATEIVLGKTPEVIQLDKLRANLARNPKSRYCLNRYENHLTKIQVFVLKAVQQLNADLKAWDTSFLMENERLPNSSDYSRSEESRGILHKRKVALKLLESWKISVHL